jgi:archaeal type IV pilus assembly protein PilA
MIIKMNDEAVSPIMGVILMVAITLILATIIATYAFGMAESIHNMRVVATSVVKSGSDIVVTYRGGAAHPDLNSITIVAPDGTSFHTISPEGALSTTGTPVTPDVGAVMVLPHAATNNNDHVTVIGHFNDGSEQIISNVYV